MLSDETDSVGLLTVGLKLLQAYNIIWASGIKCP